MDHCVRKEQVLSIAYLLEEFAPVYPPALEAPLRFKQYNMFMKFGDVEGVNRVLRRMDRLDSTE